MRIPRDRARALDAAQPMAMPAREQRRTAVRRVDVQPDAVLVAERRDRLEVVERTGRGRTGGGDDRHHARAAPRQLVERAAQRVRDPS